MDKVKKYSVFDEYLHQVEPAKREAAQLWGTAIGLQAVDGLKPSQYLVDSAKRNIDGEISIDDVHKLVNEYYQAKGNRSKIIDEEQEADKVSVNIAKLLSSDSVAFNYNGLVSTHRLIFDGVFHHAGKLRDYNITKREWVLEGDTVSYMYWQELKRAIEYDIEQERNFSYNNIDRKDIVKHITKFVSGLWQIHPFCEGNTRTTAVFTIQYLRSIGFPVDNSLFERYSWYFRNALVRANYKNVPKGIDYTPKFLECFFENLLFGTKWILRNREMHLNWDGDILQSANVAVSKCNFTADEMAVLRLVSRNAAITQCELARAIGKSERTVKNITKSLKDNNVLSRINGRRDGRWIIAPGVILED